jgi:TRAP transporter TAXI family solute receptor
MAKKTQSWLAVLATAALVACGSEGRVEFLSLGTAGTGGIYYPLGGAIASRMSISDSTRQYTAEVSGGSVENINRLGAGQMDIAMVIAMTAYQAQRGEGDFTQPVSGLRAVAPLYANVTHIMVPGDGAQSVADFGGLRVSVGPAGSGTEQLSRHILEAHGLTYDDVQPRYLSFAESSAALRDGAIDAAIISVGYPAAAVLEATTTSDVRLIGIDMAVMEEMLEIHPYYTIGEVPGGIYRGVEEPIPTLGVQNWIVGMESLNDEVVLTVLNVMQDDRVALEQVHDMAKQIDLSRMARPPIPLHPAAESWFARR